MRYLIQTGALRANKTGGRWLIDAADLPLSEPQRAAVGRRERALCELVLTGRDEAEPLIRGIEQDLMAAFPGLLRRL